MKVPFWIFASIRTVWPVETLLVRFQVNCSNKPLHRAPLNNAAFYDNESQLLCVSLVFSGTMIVLWHTNVVFISFANGQGPPADLPCFNPTNKRLWT